MKLDRWWTLFRHVLMFIFVCIVLVIIENTDSGNTLVWNVANSVYIARYRHLKLSLSMYLIISSKVILESGSKGRLVLFSLLRLLTDSLTCWINTSLFNNSLNFIISSAIEFCISTFNGSPAIICWGRYHKYNDSSILLLSLKWISYWILHT